MEKWRARQWLASDGMGAARAGLRSGQFQQSSAKKFSEETP
jgi:hypothetical protein